MLVAAGTATKIWSMLKLDVFLWNIAGVREGMRL